MQLFLCDTWESGSCGWWWRRGAWRLGRSERDAVCAKLVSCTLKLVLLLLKLACLLLQAAQCCAFSCVCLHVLSKLGGERWHNFFASVVLLGTGCPPCWWRHSALDKKLDVKTGCSISAEPCAQICCIHLARLFFHSMFLDRNDTPVNCLTFLFGQCCSTATILAQAL